MRVIGLDIGTTTIGVSVVDGRTGNVLESIVTGNNSFLTDGYPWEKRQDPQKIWDTVKDLINQAKERHSPISGIGVTGQMHGIVYLNANGQPVSPLYTWQDGRGDQPYADGLSYAGYLSQCTGQKVATGFGAVTHFYNMKNGLVPQDATVFCTIHDYVAMRLAEKTSPRVHASDAASLGLFDVENGCFDTTAQRLCGMEGSKLFPPVCNDYEKLGETSDGIPVIAAIGDNQASFLGAVQDMNRSLLINVGTGSQISLCSDHFVRDAVMETRPLVEGMYLLVGSSLCGGRAYALLEQFCRTLVQEAGFDCESLYPTLDRLSADFEKLENPLSISTRFSGTRAHPDERGTIANLGIDNFTPRHFAAGVLDGTVSELYELYAGMTAVPDFHATTVVGSGNGVRKGEVLRRMVTSKFGATVQVPAHHEEAAYGAALCALVGTGACSTMQQAQKIIQYEE